MRPRLDDATLAALADPDSPIGGRGVSKGQQAAAELVQWRELAPFLRAVLLKAEGCRCVRGASMNPMGPMPPLVHKCMTCKALARLDSLLRGEPEPAC